jgi:hypothetical protein
MPDEYRMPDEYDNVDTHLSKHNGKIIGLIA